jgi:hypothetical protein
VSDDGERVAILRGRELVVRDLWSAEVTKTYVDVGVSAEDIDFMPDGRLLVVPSSAEGDLSPRRIEADGTVVEEPFAVVPNPELRPIDRPQRAS